MLCSIRGDHGRATNRDRDLEDDASFVFAFFFAGVFCLFGALILVASSPNFKAQSVGDVFWTVVLAGLFAIVWAYVATRGKYWIFAILFPLQFLANYLLGKYSPRHGSLESNLPALKHRLLLDAGVEIALIIGAYTLFLIFFGHEGNRFSGHRPRCGWQEKSIVRWFPSNTGQSAGSSSLVVRSRAVRLGEIYSISWKAMECGTPMWRTFPDMALPQAF